MHLEQKLGPLGLEDYRIQDSQLTASSKHLDNYGPKDGRLHGPRAWVAAQASHGQWFQVDFMREVKVTEIWTQGRNHAFQFSKSYHVSYSLDAVTFLDYQRNGYATVSKFYYTGVACLKASFLVLVELSYKFWHNREVKITSLLICGKRYFVW